METFIAAAGEDTLVNVISELLGDKDDVFFRAHPRGWVEIGMRHEDSGAFWSGFKPIDVLRAVEAQGKLNLAKHDLGLGSVDRKALARTLLAPRFMR